MTDAVQKQLTTTNSLEDGFEEIGVESCMKILRQGSVGALALSGPSAPEIRPVNFAISRQRIAIDTGRSTIFDAALRGDYASFVATEIDPVERSGQSVIVSGRLAICDPSDSAIRTRIQRWVKTENRSRVLLSIEQISGRRILAPRYALDED